MTDESNALVQIILNREEMPKVSQEGAVGTECFDGFLLLTKEEAQKILKDGVDDQGFLPVIYLGGIDVLCDGNVEIIFE